MDTKKIGQELHDHVPQGWYYESLKKDPLQKIWHSTRFNAVKKFSEHSQLILDVGCSDGVFTNKILGYTKAKKVYAIDVVKSSVDWARKHWKKNKKLVFKQGDAHNLKFKDNYFDSVYCLEALEHVADPKKAIREFKRVMKPNGFGLFLVPSDNNLFKIIWWFWLNFYPRGWVWRDTHIQTYRANFLTEICKKAGFKIEADYKFNLGMLHLVKVRKIK